MPKIDEKYLVIEDENDAEVDIWKILENDEIEKINELDERIKRSREHAEKDRLIKTIKAHENDKQAKAEFDRKNDALLKFSQGEYSAHEFYKFVFGDSTQKRKRNEWSKDKKANPILMYQEYIRYEDGTIATEIAGMSLKKKTRMRNEIIYSDYDFSKAEYCNFALMGLYSCWGKRSTKEHAWLLYGFAIDLDGVGFENLGYLLSFARAEVLFPMPTFIVNSGHGLHVYFIFDEPMPLTPRNQRLIQQVKDKYTNMVWNAKTSQIDIAQRQYQSIFQKMRAVGSKTKLAPKDAKTTKYVLRAFKYGDKLSWARICSYLPVDFKFDLPMDLATAKEKYPEWYERVVVKGQKGIRYNKVDKAVYDWWLDKCFNDDDLKVGHRYYAASCLFAFGAKCELDFDDVYEDALSLIPHFNEIADKDTTMQKTFENHEPFTEYDVDCASQMYAENWRKMSRQHIEKITRLDCTPSIRRNGRTQEEHLKRARLVRTLSTYENNGAPTKEDIVKAYFEENPNATIKGASRDLGISKNTIKKWKN